LGRDYGKAMKKGKAKTTEKKLRVGGARLA